MNENSGFPYKIEDMQPRDLDEVMEIESRSFTSPWSLRSYRYELTSNSFSHFIVVRRAVSVGVPAEGAPGLLNRLLRPSPQGHACPVLGYGGFWLCLDEAHISTLAVAPDWRGLGLGSLLVLGLLERATKVNAEVASLEVRVSNLVAQKLYRKYRFQTVGIQSGYYQDNKEDALVMTSPPLRSRAFQEHLHRNRVALVGLLKEGRRQASDRPTSRTG
jgi:ribosomal-protein-alanine N-acetyltransferase